MRLALVLLAALAACTPAEPEARPRVLRDVVQSSLQALEAQVGEDPPVEATVDADELRERVQGFLRDIARSQGAMRDVIKEDLTGLGDQAVPELVKAVHSDQLDGAGRAAALEILGRIDTRRSAEALVAQAEGAPESWIRAHAAWHLGATTQDHVVPALLLRLKYEKDHETVIWLAATLARFGNYAGLEGLRVIANGANEALRASAAQRQVEIAEAAGLPEPELFARWSGASHAGELPEPEVSDRHRLEVWRQITKLSGEHFQLRGVDDARFVLSRGAPWVAGPLAEALEERDLYTRVHAAQCLERMGPRAVAAGPALLAALEDPLLAPNAADALGRIAYLDAQVALIDRLLVNHPLDVRVASARALGALGAPPAVGPLRVLLAPEAPRDLRQAAAEALLDIGLSPETEREVVPLLIEGLGGGELDPGAAEKSVERWLAGRAASGDERAVATLAEWRELDRAVPGVPPSSEEVAARQTARQELVRDALGELLGEQP